MVLILLMAFTFYAYSKTLKTDVEGIEEVNPLHMYDGVYFWLIGLTSVALVISFILLFLKRAH